MECFNFTRSTDGRCIEFRIRDNYLDWKYKTDLEWNHILCLNDIGTKNYTDLTHKPSIDGIELVGDVTLDSLGLVKTWSGTSEEFEHDRLLLSPNTICIITDDVIDGDTDSETTSSGIYIGDGDMPENCVLQIIPDGDMSTAEDIPINDLNNFFHTDTVEGALNELSKRFNRLTETVEPETTLVLTDEYSECVLSDVQNLNIIIPEYGEWWLKMNTGDSVTLTLTPVNGNIQYIGPVPQIDSNKTYEMDIKDCVVIYSEVGDGI